MLIIYSLCKFEFQIFRQKGIFISILKYIKHYWDVSSVPIEPAVILRYHEKRGKVPRIRVISFRKTSLSILKTHLTWRLRSCISTFKIVPIIVSQFQLILTKMIIDKAFFHKKCIYKFYLMKTDLKILILVIFGTQK